ncbi:hypothetical protein BDY21DRAFT_359937 [Lineolata rhizophorae]|uniref:Uncharacterized protein n=1 Tax=Lineolata rhizophorae TaxID=578093 RepID=A0A6A6PDS0_9PEZI|nr:hypothetical protein BDY21DRAFT_359937 [Lineolata rhizophorae]
MSGSLTWTYKDTPILHQSKEALYEDGSEALYKVTDVGLSSFEWTPVAKWENLTTETSGFEQAFAYNPQPIVMSGKDVNDQWDFCGKIRGAELRLWEVGRSFGEHRDGTTVTFTARTNVAPNSAVYLYQKEHRFTPQVWFRLYAWENEWTVARRDPEGHLPLTLLGTVSVRSDEYLMTPAPLEQYQAF